MTDVIVKCRVCDGQAPASKFQLSIDHKMMVCPNCMKKKSAPMTKRAEVKPESMVSKPKPAGWDAEDAMLEKMAKQKENTTIEIPRTGTGVLNCRKCSYPIKMNFDTRRPNNCPYCGRDVYN